MFKDQAIRIVVNKPCHIVRDKAYDINREIIEYDEELVKEKETELQAEYDAQEYARDRASSYPSVGDQLDMLMKDMKNGTTTHQEACEAVKDKYPKP